MTSFTAHNICFPDGSLTIPEHPHVLADVSHCQGVKRVLSIVYGENCEGKRVVDLGCLEGDSALEFARMGLDSFGIEVRTLSFENCQEVKRRAGLPNLDFAQDDV
jgi:tRNA G46 methylase TrmB